MVFGIVLCCALVLIVALAASFSKNFSASDEDIDSSLKTEKILDCLPRTNCGACGYSKCSDLASAIVRGTAPFNSCPAGGQAVSQAIGVLMGEDTRGRERMRAQVMCSGADSSTRKKYIYEGADDCLAAMRLGGGDKSCKFACVGLGNCKVACPFDAISIKDGVAFVDYTRCKGCGICVSACPKHIIKLIPYDAYHWVGCTSCEAEAKTRSNCLSGCTGCGKCAAVCPEGAITVTRNCAEIDYSKCSGCGICYQTCPQGTIWRADAFGAEGLNITKGLGR